MPGIVQALLSVQGLRELRRPRRQRDSIPSALEVLALIPEHRLGRLEITGEKLEVRPCGSAEDCNRSQCAQLGELMLRLIDELARPCEVAELGVETPERGRMDARPKTPIVSSALSSVQREIPRGTGVGPQ